MKRELFAVLAGLESVALVFFALQGGESPALNATKPFFLGSMELGHFIAYAIYAVLLALAAGKWDRKTLAVALVWASAFGAVNELLQFLAPGRTPDVFDWAVDTAGAALGIAVLMTAKNHLRLFFSMRR